MSGILHNRREYSVYELWYHKGKLEVEMRWVRPWFVHLSMCNKYSSQLHMFFSPLFGCWAVVSMILGLPYKKLLLELQDQKEMHCEAWPREEAMWDTRSVWGVGRSHFYLLKADEFNLRWQRQNRFQPFTPTSASLIMLPVLTQAFKNQYNLMQLPVASGNGKACQEWEMRVFLGCSWFA